MCSTTRRSSTLAEDQEQVDKLLEARPQVPTLRHVFFDDPRGMRNYENVVSYDELARQGRAHDAAHPQLFDAEVATTESVDVFNGGSNGSRPAIMSTPA